MWATKEIKAPILIHYYVSEQELFNCCFFKKLLGGIPLNRYKKGVASLLVICVLALTACSPNTQLQQNDASNITQSAETVVAQRGSLTPTLSMQTTVIQASAFALSSPVNGAFETQNNVGDKLIAGDVIGVIDGNKIKVPVDGIILSLAPSGENVPKNYPVAIVSYTGFALNVEAENYLKTLPESTVLHAKFQISDGIGPTESIAVVTPVTENNGDIGQQSFTPQTTNLQCLIGQDVDVKPGQSATVVISAETRKDVLILPLSVIAGRQDKGVVTVIKDEEEIQTEVVLGASDGAYIEILSGLEEGDVISSLPPNLDPRRNS